MATKERNYSREHAIRQKRNKRLAADLERAKAEAFIKHLHDSGQTYISWLNKQIDNEMK